MTTTTHPDAPELARTEADAVALQARLATTPIELAPLGVHIVTTPTGALVVDLDTDVHRARAGQPPARKTGSVTVTEAASLVTYVNHHAEADACTLWADRDRARIVAVLNGHAENQPEPEADAGWGDHRATLNLKHTPAWLAWTRISGTALGQQAFADFLEEHLPDIVEPEAATLVEIVTTIEQSIGATMKSAIRLDNGQTQVAYEENIETKAGKAGTLAVPSKIKLALTPFEGGDPYGIEARLRTRTSNGTVTFAVLLDRPEDVLRHAFGDIVAEVETVLHGTPIGG